MEDNYNKILWEGYGLRFYGGGRTRTGFVCKTDKGLREIRKTFAPRESIEFEHDVREQLYQNGFTAVCRFFPTVDGKASYFRDGCSYTMEVPMSGQALEEYEDGFIQGARLLGEMHAAGKGVQSNVCRSNINHLPEVYTKRRNELVRIRKRIDKQKGLHPLDLMVREKYEHMMTLVEAAKEVILSAEYDDVMAEAEEMKSICHNAFKGDNVRCDENHIYFVTGFGKCAYDSPIIDLSAYFRRYVKKTDGNLQTAEKMLSAYEQLHPLSKKEKKVFIGILTYPEKFLRLCNEYYNKRRVCVSPAMCSRMELCIAAQEKQDIFVKGFCSIIGED